MFSELIVFKIRDICKEKGISINKLSRMSGITQSTLNSIVNGNSNNPKILTLKKICDGLNISLTQFFDDDFFR